MTQILNKDDNEWRDPLGRPLLLCAMCEGKSFFTGGHISKEAITIYNGIAVCRQHMETLMNNERTATGAPPYWGTH